MSHSANRPKDTVLSIGALIYTIIFSAVNIFFSKKCFFITILLYDAIYVVIFKEKQMKIAIGSDHGGFETKEFLKQILAQKGIDTDDIGTYSADSCDYPLIADKMAEVILSKKAEFGVLVCGTGIGISIAANRYKGIRAALLYSDETAALAREHNDANVAVFGGRTQKKEDISRYLEIFLATPFSGGERHCRRIQELG